MTSRFLLPRQLLATVEAAAGAQNANREAAPDSRVPHINPGATTGDQHNRRSETPNRTETPNNRSMNTGEAQQSNSVRTRFLEGINRITGRNLFGESPSRAMGEETLAPASAEQETTQSGNGGVETQDATG